MFSSYNYSQGKAARYLCLDRDSFMYTSGNLQSFLVDGRRFYDKRVLDLYRINILNKYNLQESAKYLGCELTGLRSLIRDGKVKCERSKLDKYTYIYKSELDRLKESLTQGVVDLERF